MAQRIKGQEVEVRLIVNNALRDQITDVRSFEVAIQLEVLSEGYLGETTNRRDDVHTGVRGRIELHFENDDILTLAQEITDRARRRTPGTTITIKATLAFPAGVRRQVLIENVFFGEIPFSAGSRTDYVSTTLDFEAERLRFL